MRREDQPGDAIDTRAGQRDHGLLDRRPGVTQPDLHRVSGPELTGDRRPLPLRALGERAQAVLTGLPIAS